MHTVIVVLHEVLSYLTKWDVGLYLCLDVQPEHNGLGEQVEPSKQLLRAGHIAAMREPVQPGEDVQEAGRIHQGPCLPAQLPVVPLALVAASTPGLQSSSVIGAVFSRMDASAGPSSMCP